MEYRPETYCTSHCAVFESSVQQETGNARGGQRRGPVCTKEREGCSAQREECACAPSRSAHIAMCECATICEGQFLLIAGYKCALAGNTTELEWLALWKFINDRRAPWKDTYCWIITEWYRRKTKFYVTWIIFIYLFLKNKTPRKKGIYH